MLRHGIIRRVFWPYASQVSMAAGQISPSSIDPTPVQRVDRAAMPVRIRSWRRWLRRLLKRSAQSPPPSILSQQPAGSLPLPVSATPPAAVPLPAVSVDALEHHAGRYFEYAEELSRRGSPELAAPFYRQAYVLQMQMAAGQHTALPEPLSPPVPPAVKDVEQQSWTQQIHALRASLNRETAAGVLAELQRLRQQGCSTPELLTLEGVTSLMLDDRTAAERYFRDALALDDLHYPALVNLGGLCLTEKRPAEAIQLLRQALEQREADSLDALPALANLALAYRQVGQAMESALLVLRVHKLRPGHLRPGRLLEAAQTLQEMGEDPDAIELLNWLASHRPSAPVLRLLGELLERRGEYREAALAYRRLHDDSGLQSS